MIASVLNSPFNFGAPPGGDPYFASVVLLAHMNGTNGGTSFPDDSLSAKTLTAYGNAQTSTAQSKFNGSSGLFDGAGDYVKTPHSADFNFGTGDWTLEFFCQWNSISGYQTILDHGYGSLGAISIQTGLNTGKFIVYTSGVARVTETSATPSTGVWYYYAFVQSGGTITIYRDAVAAGSASNPADLTITAEFGIGARASNGTYGANAYIAEYRLTKGVARDVTSIPTAAFPDS
jgi:hypothetical protein